MVPLRAANMPAMSTGPFCYSGPFCFVFFLLLLGRLLDLGSVFSLVFHARWAQNEDNGG